MCVLTETTLWSLKVLGAHRMRLSALFHWLCGAHLKRDCFMSWAVDRFPNHSWPQGPYVHRARDSTNSSELMSINSSELMRAQPEDTCNELGKRSWCSVQGHMVIELCVQPSPHKEEALFLFRNSLSISLDRLADWVFVAVAVKGKKLNTSSEGKNKASGGRQALVQMTGNVRKR